MGAREGGALAKPGNLLVCYESIVYSQVVSNIPSYMYFLIITTCAQEEEEEEEGQGCKKDSRSDQHIR